MGRACVPSRRTPSPAKPIPVTLGHEFSAVVEAVGADVAGFAALDRVAVQPIMYDGTCVACRAGHINCCYSNGFLGLSGGGGGLSESVVVPPAFLHHLPASVPLELGALVEPLAVGWHAVKASPFAAGHAVLVLGGGPIGMAVLQALRARGADAIVVSEVSARRRRFAHSFGAHEVLDPAVDDVVARCRARSEGGVHVVFDCAGVQAGVDTGLAALRVRGTYMNIALWERPCAITPNVFLFKERAYMGVATYQAADFGEVIAALADGTLQPAAMITTRIQLHEVEDKGFRALIDDKDNQLKVLVDAGAPRA